MFYELTFASAFGIMSLVFCLIAPTGILNNFSLSNLFAEEYEADVGADHENRLHKKLFKDKKLNRLWEKAEKSGFTEMELKALKDEFGHHQDKLDEYYAIMESLTAEEKSKLVNFYRT